MKKIKPKQDGWEEEFDRLFYRIDRFGNTGVIYGKEGLMAFAKSDKSQLTAIKDFIRTEIEKAEQRGREQVKIEYVAKIGMIERSDKPDDYRAAIDDIYNLLNS